MSALTSLRPVLCVAGLQKWFVWVIRSSHNALTVHNKSDWEAIHAHIQTRRGAQNGSPIRPGLRVCIAKKGNLKEQSHPVRKIKNHVTFATHTDGSNRNRDRNGNGSRRKEKSKTRRTDISRSSRGSKWTDKGIQRPTFTRFKILCCLALPGVHKYLQVSN